MLKPDFWRRYFRVYDVLNSAPPYRKLLAEIVRRVDPKFGDYILDAGVGTGNLAILLAAKGARVVGLDFSPEAIEIYRGKEPHAETILADLTAGLPMFSNGAFDVVVSNNTLYNIPHERRLFVVQELRRIIRPGGRIVLANIHKGFRPVSVYRAAIRDSIRESRFLHAIWMTAYLLIPAIRILYYNWHIQAAYKFQRGNLFDLEEQKHLLEQAGFRRVSPTRVVYAGQGILNAGWKE